MPPFPFAAPCQIRLGLTSSASACEWQPCLTLLRPPVTTATYAKPLKSVLAPVPLKTRNKKLASQLNWERFWKSRSSKRRLQRLRSGHLVANKSQRQRGPHLRTGSHGAPEGASPVGRQGAPLDHGLYHGGEWMTTIAARCSPVHKARFHSQNGSFLGVSKCSATRAGCGH